MQKYLAELEVRNEGDYTPRISLFGATSLSSTKMMNFRFEAPSIKEARDTARKHAEGLRGKVKTLFKLTRIAKRAPK
jgi:hypothetical protein